jgi:ABC-2 type transport system permease protein
MREDEGGESCHSNNILTQIGLRPARVIPFRPDNHETPASRQTTLPPEGTALASIAVWLFFTVFWGIIAGFLAQTLMPIRIGLAQEVLAQANLEMALSRLSPNTLYAEVMVALLQPQIRSLGILLPSQLEGAILGAPLPLGQSTLLVWPQLTGLIAGSILLFALAYVLFQRQEIRA